MSDWRLDVGLAQGGAVDEETVHEMEDRLAEIERQSPDVSDQSGS